MTRLDQNQKHRVRFTLNGAAVEIEVAPRTVLTDTLRHGLGATGTHVGCEHGVCGACTIQIDGTPARACLTFAVQVEGCAVRTIEGLAPAPGEDGQYRLSILQAAFRRHHALQCGFCTAGILMSLDAFLRETPSPSIAMITEVIGGHLCRCTGYAPIIDAAMDAASALRDDANHV